MSNEQRAREVVSEYYNIPQKEDTESFDDIVDSVPKSLMRDIIKALDEKDAQLKAMREALGLAVAGLQDVSDWCEYHSGPTADKYLEYLKELEKA